MQRPGTITLLVAGVAFLVLSSVFLAPTTFMRPVRGPSGEFLRRPDGTVKFERDTLRQMKHDWLPETMGIAGAGCVLWTTARGIKFLYGRTHKHMP